MLIALMLLVLPVTVRLPTMLTFDASVRSGENKLPTSV